MFKTLLRTSEGWTLDERVRVLVADGRKMFTHSPLSEKELELLARSVIDAEPNRVGEGDS